MKQTTPPGDMRKECFPPRGVVVFENEDFAAGGRGRIIAADRDHWLMVTVPGDVNARGRSRNNSDDLTQLGRGTKLARSTGCIAVITWENGFEAAAKQLYAVD